ncbi:ParB/RepB/Spo0J family partition protein [Sphingomonas sp. 10B4]|uniref:ParB/RepB/Spo0J family partition protein n=1 Tax=Sphingomonas sp. 10B4 TaxID=3048575 RepID=UPI002AB3D4A3|nr:ParB/RepB/Spo0J family partition protein [Sphingomonas sp. 10B4]MDY7522825.1 ParB/RepB/Spo0J family partition protein [Sphingomonas sp. 10B4]MEB0283844.1 ParB/RepB/Spo0J family partition protein [Sphingomonas sp. 10B4]
MTLQTVKLSQLRLSPLNVRRVKPKAIDQLAADMLAHGQLQNLVVYAEGNRFEVAAGGRRYRAFKQLERAKAIPASHPVSVDVRDKAEAVELSLAENVQREAMHVADAVIAYGDLRSQGKSPEDIATRFGVALSYVKKVLRLSALHPDALACLARDQIGMEAAQALTLAEDHDRQLEALKRFGNSGHQIRRMLTEEKIGTTSALFLFVGHKAYIAAGGTITADLFAEGGDGYADDPALVETLATAKMAEIEAGYRAEGWCDVRASLQRPDDYYTLVTVHAEGMREPTEEEQIERTRIQDAADARATELGNGNRWGDRVFSGLERDARILENRLCVFTDAQKAESAMVLFVGNGGEIEAKAIRTKRIAKGSTGDEPAIKPDYSGAMIETLSKIKTLAVQEAVATNPALALDILLDCLVGQGIHSEPSYYSPLSLRLEGFNAGVPDDMMTLAEIASVDEIGGSDFAALPEVNRFAAIQAMDAEAKGRLLALLVARQINGGQSSGMRRDRRHQRFDQIAFASGVDMVAKWQAPVAFYDRLKKPVIAKIMTEVLGKPAADNCAKMKKGELAVDAAERMAGKGWLPPALAITEPPAEVEQERADCDDDEEGDDGDDAPFDEQEAA